ncbi:ATP-binding protein [Algirhabdus cladophorae]|uniref:sensor histidine kinase NtrY-like n=1 Tax=Algirhabdus cladophorae TaxID=3377108 RepID=UPI003B8470D7
MSTRKATSSIGERLSRLRRKRSVQNGVTIAIVCLGPVLAVLTFFALGPLQNSSVGLSLRLILLVDLVYVLVVASLVLQRVARMIAARRARSAGSRLHLRLTGVFALCALIPTVLVAVFAGLTINIGLEGWFSERVRTVIGASRAAAEAYEAEHRNDLRRDAVILASYINAANATTLFVGDSELRELLTAAQPNIQRGLKEAYVIDGSMEIRARGERSYLFDFERPTEQDLIQARENGVTIIQDWPQNEFRALLPLTAYLDRYLYISRTVDGEILNLLDDTQQTAALYQQLESERGRVLFGMGLLYLGFAVILILAAIWLGLWFAERLSRPVGRLAGAAQQVGLGDLDVQVVEEQGDDEIAMLGRYFNQMTRQLKGQRQTLLDSTRQIERRQRLFDSVLSSVTSGVVGLDPTGQVTFANKSAERLLNIDAAPEHQSLNQLIPEFGPLFEKVVASRSGVATAEVKVARDGTSESLLVRMAQRQRNDGSLEGYVVAFDDVTDLVAAQRMAAWGDVARRIAHEIKNPLTPIQLSAERLKRKFGREVGDQASLEQMTDVIIRQTNDLRRIVDEFSKFARMPEPQRKPENITELLRGAVTLQKHALDAALVTDIPDVAPTAFIDATMIGQALTNLIKNAGEAIESYQKNGDVVDGYQPQVQISLRNDPETVTIEIADNGIGLPEDRSRLFEPYVTTRSEGTGLGLSIVKKIIEDHGGSLSLSDAPIFEGNSRFGALATVVLPLTDSENDTKQEKAV